MERPQNTAVVRINTDIPCLIYRFGKEIGRADAHDYTEIYLPKGKHRLSFVSTDNSIDKVDLEKEILDIEYEDIIDVCIYPIKNTRILKERAERERLEQIKKEQIRREQERLAKLRRIEEEKRKREEALKPYKIAPYQTLNFYDSVIIRNYGFDNPKKYFFASKNGLYTILNDSFLPTIPFQFEEIIECNGNGDYLWVKINKKWGLFNYKQRQYIIVPRFDDISRTRHSDNCYTLIVTIGDKMGVINDKGELFIDCKYEKLYEVAFGEYYQAKLNGMEGLLDKYGRVKLDFVYKDLNVYSSRGKYPTEYRGKYGVLNYAGDIIFDFIYDKIEYREPFGCGYHILVKNGKYGIHICATGEIIPCQYNSLDEIPDFKLESYY